MANTREIRRRIKSVKNTAQITKAMQMVAASKMRRAQALAIAGREYASLMNRILASLRDAVEPGAHPLLAERPVKNELVLIISTDRGLCGALNTNLFREVVARFPGDNVQYVAAGKKAVQFLVRTGRNLVADFHLPDAPKISDTRPISKFCVDQFLDGKVDKVTVVYTHFVNTLVQKATVQAILPIDAADLPQLKGGEEKEFKLNGYGYIFEPDLYSVLEAILRQYIRHQTYQTVLDARASEHSARMVAMKSATDNAKQLVKDLSLEYNKVRQAAITTELLEITTAQTAVGG